MNIDWATPTGIIVIGLLVIDVILFSVGIFMRERHLSHLDKVALVEERKITLEKLQLSLDARLRATRPLINKAQKLPLPQYWEKYLKNSFPYILTRQMPKKPIEITNALVRRKFVWDNLYYQELKETDSNYRQVVDNYNIIFSKLDEMSRKALEDQLGWFWKLEHISNSLQIYATMTMSNKRILNVPLGYRGGLRGKHMSANGFQDCLIRVEGLISRLERGEDL